MLLAERTEEKSETLAPVARAPRVSVIIHAYNSARFLAQALESVFSQNYDDYEIIVVDDGSTDDTEVVLESYADRIRTIYQENAGSAAARNTGLDLARGEFIVFLDADDLFLPGRLRQQAAYLDVHPSPGMVHSGWRLINEHGGKLRDVELWHEAPRLDLETWLLHSLTSMGATLFQGNLLECRGRFEPGLRLSHDVRLGLESALHPRQWNTSIDQ